jgi:hypothetical protein
VTIGPVDNTKGMCLRSSDVSKYHDDSVCVSRESFSDENAHKGAFHRTQRPALRSLVVDPTGLATVASGLAVAVAMVGERCCWMQV